MPRDPMPERLVPMLAKLAKLPREDGGWAYEIKWDGVRAIAYASRGGLRLESRNLNDVTPRYPEVAGLTAALGGREAVLDGEVVAFDERGTPSFERLQGRMHLTTGVEARARITPVTYVAFDLLWLDGESLMRLPYTERRERLESLQLDGPAWRVPSFSSGNGPGFLEASAAQGLEGVICKRLDSPYEPGRRGNSWLKVKNTRRQELVIGGWQPGAGKRAGHLGALLVGFYEDGELRYGGKVGTGFDQRELVRLQGLLAQRTRPTTPFTGRQPERGSHYVEPDLVAEIEFTEWTSQNMLRHPSYKGLRDDKRPVDVVLEKAEEPPAGLTTAEVLDYYQRAAPVLLPHVRELAPDLPALLELVNSGVVELHTSHPEAVVFDLEGAGLDRCREVALLMRGMFDQLKLATFPKTTGSGGIQVYVPLNGDTGRDDTEPFAKAVAETLERGFPDRIAANGPRKGRVLVDWSQRPAVAPYSLCATDRLTVSMPLSWAEVESARTGELVFDPEAALARIDTLGDLFASVLTLRQELPTFG